MGFATGAVVGRSSLIVAAEASDSMAATAKTIQSLLKCVLR